MASWRKNLPVLPESLREEESDGDNSSADVSRTFLKRYSPASFDSYSPDNDKETDSNESDTGVSEKGKISLFIVVFKLVIMHQFTSNS